MALVNCPECGTKISEKSTVCPYCGYIGEDKNLPICAQSVYVSAPMFECDILEWKPNEDTVSVISYEDNRTLYQAFGAWEKIQVKLPAIADTIYSLAQKENVMVAQMDDYVKKLIEKGIYRFSVDKAGNILPTIRDSSGIVKQVRLTEMQFAPQVSQSLNNLANQAAMAQILHKIEYVGESIKQIHIGLQNDRLALADTARDMLRAAMCIEDARLRQAAIINAINQATEAKCVLMRNFSQNLLFIRENSNKSFFALLIDTKSHDMEQKALDAMKALVAITNTVQLECTGYSGLGEYEAAQKSLLQFRTFILESELDKRDTLLTVNENLEGKQLRVVEEFGIIANKIKAFKESHALKQNPILQITD